MDYQTIRPTIRSGDLLSWSHRGIRSWHDLKIALVRMFTKSEYSHVGTAWVVGSRVLVIEAVIPLVRIYPLSKLGDFYHLPLDAPWKPDTEALALSYVGHAYSQLQAIQSPFMKPKHDELWECAELAAHIALSDGIDLGQIYTPSEVVRNAQLRGSLTTLVTQEKTNG